MQKELSNIIEKLSKIPDLRSAVNKEAYYGLVNEIVKTPDLLNSLFKTLADKEADYKYKKTLGEMLVDEGVLSMNKLIELGILKKSYNKSGYFINIPEEKYIEKGLALLPTDYSANIEDLFFNGVYDYLGQKSLLTPADLTNLGVCEEMFIKEKRYLDKVASQKLSFSIKRDGEVKPGQGLMKKYMSEKELFFNDFIQVKSDLKGIEKVADTIGNLFKMLELEYVRQQARLPSVEEKYKEFHEKNKTAVSYFKKIAPDVLKNNFKISHQDFTKTGQNINWALNIGYGKYIFSGKYTETLDKEIKLENLNKKETKEFLINFAGKVKSMLSDRGYYQFRKKGNFLVTKVKDKEYQENPNYQPILRFVEKWEF